MTMRANPRANPKAQPRSVVRGAGGAAPPPAPTERIVNGGFDDASSWSIPSGWVIGSGVAATDGLTARTMTQTLAETILSGTSIRVQADVDFQSSSSSMCAVRLLLNGVLVQTLSSAIDPTGGAMIGNHYDHTESAAGDFNQLQFRTTAAVLPDQTLDNVSLLA